jgi:hypothetical protein
MTPAEIIRNQLNEHYRIMAVSRGDVNAEREIQCFRFGCGKKLLKSKMKRRKYRSSPDKYFCPECYARVKFRERG